MLRAVLALWPLTLSIVSVRKANASQQKTPCEATKKAGSALGTEPASYVFPPKLTLEQSQHVLRIRVRNLQHGRARLHQNLSPGEGGSFAGEVRVTDSALGIGQVG